MAPITLSDTTFLPPIADSFFIAGIESSRIFDSSLRRADAPPNSPNQDKPEQDTGLSRTESAPTFSTSCKTPDRLSSTPQLPGWTQPSPDTVLKKARFSYDARKSIGSIIALNESKGVQSNRSSATVRAVHHGEKEPVNGLGLTDVDFTAALQKFTTERDSFREGIQFSDEHLMQSDRPRPTAKTQRMSAGALKRENSHGGSFRKRFSNMNPLSRQSTLTKRSSNRVSKRISGYNSVIPAPQRFQSQKNMHPLKRTYEPVLLDRYPSKTMVDERESPSTFPEYVPMFVFPNDVDIVAGDERPRSTWHGFAMTNSDSSKLYGMCLITWIPLKPDAAEELELQCEQWRNANMSEGERDMAKDLGERLARERARLSELLLVLPTLTSGSQERESLEEDISAVEERIHLMADALRPVRYAAASQIDGLTENGTGFWIPRAYGVLGRDASYMGFWKEWLRAIAVPMANGGVLRVPPSSPKVGLWQPLEKYVVNLCTEAPSPMTSITQVEITVRELRLYARKEAVNEIPGSRTTDLYPLFRCLNVQDVVVLMEYVLSESRIILLSSHTAMLHLAAAAITQLLYPLEWVGIFIPVLPARLIQALDAPCPYIIGIERRCNDLQLPQEDFVLVDLDQGTIEATAPPTSLPRIQRRKLVSMLQLAAPHTLRCGVSLGPPKYAMEAFPFDAFSTENTAVFDFNSPRSTLAQLASIDSTSFGANTTPSNNIPPLFNVFSQPPRTARNFGSDCPLTRTSSRESAPPSPAESSLSGSFNRIPAPRQDSGLVIQSTLRNKRSGIFLKRNSSLSIVPLTTNRMSNLQEVDDKGKTRSAGVNSSLRRPSIPFMGHSHTASISTLKNQENHVVSNYAGSIYAQSSVAASSVMALNVMPQPAKNTATTSWVEGHCLQWQTNLMERTACSVCNEKADEGIYTCSGCGMTCHHRCSEEICLVCPVAFHPDQIMTAFVRCFASLFSTYRKFLSCGSVEEEMNGTLYQFNLDGFVNSVPHDHAEYLVALRETQAFNQFIHTRTTTSSSDPNIRLFDNLIAAKRMRSRTASNFFHSTKSRSFNFYHDPHSSSNNHSGSNNNNKQDPQMSFLLDTTDHIWRTASAPSVVSRNPSRNPSASSDAGHADFGRDDEDDDKGGIRSWVGRTPAKLDIRLLREPRALQGAPRVELAGRKIRRKEVPTAVAMVGFGVIGRSKNNGTVECLR